nr:hypothetical protein [Sphaerochaeta pleomorpha]
MDSGAGTDRSLLVENWRRARADARWSMISRRAVSFEMSSLLSFSASRSWVFSASSEAIFCAIRCNKSWSFICLTVSEMKVLVYAIQ